MSKHGTASIGQYIEFQAAVLRQLPRPEEFRFEVLDGWTKNQASLQRILHGALVSPQHEKCDYFVTLNYDLPLADAIAAGKYDGVNDDITTDHFPKTRTGTAELEAQLVHFNRLIESDEVLKELDKMGLRPGELSELLAFGAKYPEKQREFPIIALGSVWQDCYGDRSAPGLWRFSGRRSLLLDWCSRRWHDDDRFLAFRKPAKILQSKT